MRVPIKEPLCRLCGKTASSWYGNLCEPCVERHHPNFSNERSTTHRRVQIHYYKPNPPNTKRVSRPSRWGNPFKLSDYTLKESLHLYRQWLLERIEWDATFLDPLIGFDLGCFCKLGEPCHGDVLLEFLEVRS